jgi:PKD repeat protein
MVGRDMRPHSNAARLPTISLAVLLLLSGLAVVAVAPTIHSAPAMISAQQTNARLITSLATAGPAVSGAAPTNSIVGAGIAALERGEGPAKGVPFSCGSSPSAPEILQISYCGPRATAPSSFSQSHPSASVVRGDAAVTPDVAYKGYVNWTNQTTYTSPTVSGDFRNMGGAVAYDPTLQEMVLFGSGRCDFCVSNQTWTYSGTGGWFNETGILAIFGGNPPNLTEMGMAWDPAWNGIIMTGGSFANGLASYQTWLFNDFGEWQNITSTVGFFPPASVYAPLVYDAALRSVVSVDGATSVSATSIWDQTELLGPPGSSWSDLAGPATTSVYAYQAAYDPITQDLVLFGGRTFNGTTWVQENFTWIYTAGEVWENITISSIGTYLGIPIFYPTYASFGGMTWDGQLNEIVLFGGMDQAGYPTNQMYIFNGTNWTPETQLFNHQPLFPPASAWFAMDTNSSAVAPAILGGACYPTTTYCAYKDHNATWVFEIRPETNVTLITPNPVDVGFPVKVSSNVTVDSGSGPFWNLTIGDLIATPPPTEYIGGANFASNLQFTTSFTFVTTGPEFTYSYVTDFWGLQSFIGYYTITVDTAVAGTPTFATPLEVVSGAAMESFSTTASGGTGTYHYAWNFGVDTKVDSTLQNPTYTYTAGGTYHGWLNVSDTGGGYTNNTFSVLVYGPLVTTAHTNVTATDVGFPVQFTGSVSGGDSPYPMSGWQFGNGHSSAAAVVSEPYAVAKTYTAYYNATDTLGFKSSASVKVVVNAALAAALASSTTSPHATKSVTFTATASYGTAPYTYSWQFGDKSTVASGTAVESHAFSAAGTYQVNVTITDAVGAKMTAHLVETVSKAPSTSVVPGLSNTDLYALLGVLAAVVIIAALFLVMRRRKKPAQVTPPAPWSEGPPNTPGTSTGPNPPPAPPPGAA